jgi:UDP-N-acetylglucosamine 4,6-dehydratase
MTTDIPTDALSHFDGKSILVTGGTGSFGRHFIRTLLRRSRPARLLVFSRDELKQYEMQQDDELSRSPAMRYLLGDVRDVDRLEIAMRDVDIVVHAAALKHVPAAEYNPFECIKTNVHGAENIVKAALRTGVRRVIALSTDKAANPINLYGASKLASDKVLIAANNLSGSQDTRFSIVRYGNVMGSRGSVIPLFQRLATEGADALPITDARMTRFFITLQEGVDFVCTSLSWMKGGEIFVPKIPSMKIIDLAQSIAPNLPIKEVGIRPGEKLHEILITPDDSRYTIEYDNHFIIEPAFAFWTKEETLPTPGKPVAEGFQYTSDQNADWLAVDDVRKLLKRNAD